MDSDTYECATCGETVHYADLGEVLLHEHQGITERVDVSGVEPGQRVDP